MTREQEYEEWVGIWEDTYDGDVSKTCREATTEMVAVFPELRRVRGFVYLIDEQGFPLSGGYPHWWCVSEESGKIVDPTASQFTLPVTYKALEDVPDEPVGRCLNCGKVVTARRLMEGGISTICSDDCSNKYMTNMGV